MSEHSSESQEPESPALTAQSFSSSHFFPISFLSRGCTKVTINAVNIIFLLCTCACIHQLSRLHPAAQFPEQGISALIRRTHAGCALPPEAHNAEQSTQIPLDSFRNSSEELLPSVATGCGWACPGWPWQCSPQPRPPPACPAVLLLPCPPDLALRVPCGFIKACLTQTVGKHFREKLSFVKDRQCLCSNVGTSKYELLQWRVEKTRLRLSYPFGWEDKKRISIACE